ncbi:MAG: DUF3732 domain-containing protein [Bacteroidetes bacterium]|nr:DUF3732 domain-containing protein [Bacteroidota bacterium]
MYFQLLKVILWPRKLGVKPREVIFQRNMVNVISGSSKTGKSAVIPIIDYCLGSQKCAIPVGVIRESCSWFGIVIDTIEGEKLLVRKEPGNQQSSHEMVLIENELEINIPETITHKITNVTLVKSMLNRLSGLSNLAFEPNTSDGFKSRPSFRDLMAFTFQPQNIVANPDVMFFKADTTEHREKLKTVFPYVLGAVSPKSMYAQHELDRLQRLLRTKESELRSRQKSNEIWQREGQTWLRQAIEYGLIPPDFEIPNNWDEIIDVLRELPNQNILQTVPSLTSMDSVIIRLQELRKIEINLTAQVNESRQQLLNLKQLNESSNTYENALLVQRDRLSLSKWIRDLTKNKSNTIFELSEIRQERIYQLCEALDAIEVRLQSHPGITENIDKETLRLRENIQILLDELKNVRTEIAILVDNSNAVRDIVAKGQKIDRFLGRLEESLRLLDMADKSSSLQVDIDRLILEISDLKTLIAEEEIARKLKNALTTIEGYAGKLVKKLDGEWPDAPVKIIIADLTIKVIRGNRDDYLWEIGSGANWLAYHIAITLALQGYFLGRPNHPVPGLLIYDQPSQVYFPTRSIMATSSVKPDPEWKNEDIKAVQKVFNLFDQVVGKKKGQLQIIVLDHADDEVWGKLKNVYLVETWRGEALVPIHWLQKI